VTRCTNLRSTHASSSEPCDLHHASATSGGGVGVYGFSPLQTNTY
jgi:hypothetical protein